VPTRVRKYAVMHLQAYKEILKYACIFARGVVLEAVVSYCLKGSPDGISGSLMGSLDGSIF
jgi:hypothetical protein